MNMYKSKEVVSDMFSEESKKSNSMTWVRKQTIQLGQTIFVWWSGETPSHIIVFDQKKNRFSCL